MAETQVTKKDEQAVEEAHTPKTDRVYVPDVDISENSECVRLVADMPGVNQKSVEVTVENNVLTVEGWAQARTPDGYKLAGQEYGVGRYRRDFTLSNAVDTEGIKARVRHGVLTVMIPKREEKKTKKIKIGA